MGRTGYSAALAFLATSAAAIARQEIAKDRAFSIFASPSAQPPFPRQHNKPAAHHASKDRPRRRESAPAIHVSQHKAGAAGAANPVAEIVGGNARFGADAHLIERADTATAPCRAEQARIPIADHSAQPLHRTGIHRKRPVAIES